MSLQADINWIQQEIEGVTNQRLIEAFKALLLYDKETIEQKSEDALKEKLISRALKSNEDLKNGRVYTKGEVIARTNTHLGL